MTRSFAIALITGAVGLLGLVSVAQADIRIGKNYRLNSDPAPSRGKDQVGLAVNPANPQHIVEVNANYLTEECEATASFDGGVTWTPAFALVPPPQGGGFAPFEPSCRITTHLAESMFQTVAFGAGNAVYATSVTAQPTATGERGQSAVLYKSTDGGRTWGTGVEAMAGGNTTTGPGAGPNFDLPTVAVDPGIGPLPDRVYIAARETLGVGNSVGCPTASCPSARIAMSTDGGQTFTAPVRASAAGEPVAGGSSPSQGQDTASPPVISPNGSISTAYRTRGANGVATVRFVRSTNVPGQPLTFGDPVTVANVANVSLPSNSHVTPVTSNGATFPRLAGNKQSGNLYIVYNQRTPHPDAPARGYRGADHFIPPDSHVYFQRSTDGGATWSTPKRINDVPNPALPGTPTVQTRHPSVSVAPNGRVDVVWQDRRHWYQESGEHNCVHTHLACDDARLGDTYYAYSDDGGNTFSANRRISDHSHNNDVGFDYRFGTGWAFGPVSVPLGNDQLLVGWMDAREGNVDDDTQDIYLARVNHSAPSAIPQENVNEPQEVPLSVALSKFTYIGGSEGLMASVFASRNGTQAVIVNKDDAADALAAGVLARANLSTVILSPAAGLSDAAKAELGRLAPAGAFVVGDTSSLSDAVMADVATAAGIPANKVTRIGGDGDAAQAANIAEQFDRRTQAEKDAGNPLLDAAVIANPASPDAAAVAGLAAARRLPILYVGADSIPAATTAVLDKLDIKKTLVIGNADDVSGGVMNQLPSPTRLGGADQYATSKAVAQESRQRGLPSNVVYVANGAKPMDGALLGPVVGRKTGIMVLAPTPLHANAAGAASGLDQGAIDRFVVLGPPAPGPGGPGPGGNGPGGGQNAKCARLKLVRRNATNKRGRLDARVRAGCAGKLTASAKTKVRIRGKRRTVRLRTQLRRLGGRNYAIRISLTSKKVSRSRKVRRALKRTRKLRIAVSARFVPEIFSDDSLPSRKRFTVVVKR